MSEEQVRIKEMAKGLGADVCGTAAIEAFSAAPEGFSPLDIYPACRGVVAVGIALPKGLLEVQPRLVYAHFNGEVICGRVDALTFGLAKAMENAFGCRAVPVPCDAPNDYWDAEHLTAKGLISMKHTAVCCGLGQLGKSTLLLNPQYGNRLTIGAILTDMPLPTDAPAESICIPGCHRCIENCPAQAIGADGHVDQQRCRPNTYGKTARGFGTVNCNRCRSGCPVRFGKLNSTD